MGVVSSCKHKLGSTRLTHISFSSRLSVSVLFSVCAAEVDLAFPVFGVSVLGLFLSTAVVFDVELPPKMIFGKFDCFVLGISSLASATDAVEVDGIGDFMLFIRFPLVGGCLCQLGSERLFYRSDEFCQSSEITVRPRVLFVFISAGMNPPEGMNENF